MKQYGERKNRRRRKRKTKELSFLLDTSSED